MLRGRSIHFFVAATAWLVGFGLQAQETTNINGLWQAGPDDNRVVIAIDQLDEFFDLSTAAGDPGWTKGKGVLLDPNPDGSVPFNLTLTTDAGFSVKLKGVVTKTPDQDPPMTFSYSNSETTKLTLLSWVPTKTPPAGRTIRVFCEGGYVARFKVTYLTKKDGVFTSQEWVSSNLAVGRRDRVTLPFDAKNVVLKGFFLSAGEREIFTENNVDYNKEYKVYGTIFDASWTTQ